MMKTNKSNYFTSGLNNWVISITFSMFGIGCNHSSPELIRQIDTSAIHKALNDDYLFRVLGESEIEEHMKDDYFYLVYTVGARWKFGKIFTLRFRKKDSIIYSHTRLIDENSSANFPYTFHDPKLEVKYCVVYKEHSLVQLDGLRRLVKKIESRNIAGEPDTLERTLYIYGDSLGEYKAKDWSSADYINTVFIKYLEDSFIAK